MNKRVLIGSALATAVAASSACGQSPTPVPAPTPPFKAEKCYGIARAGENDCASTGYNECGRTSRKALDLRAWIYVPVGYCERIQGGSLQPRL